MARQRKVTAAPRRGDANRPTRSQVLHEKPKRTTKPTAPQKTRLEGKIKAHYPLPIEPVAIPQDACVTLT
ncbi:hypothetical protein CN645_27675 [Burkholderia sp. IDO3]|nr:hypothetical protein DCN14_20325 [Burkholderia sp. IDO3]PCD58547.1 hypothetical protein CN645_27675 [Burkholderia sp. IDO3]